MTGWIIYRTESIAGRLRVEKLMEQEDTGTDQSRGVRKSYLYFVAVVAAVGGFIFGYDLSIIAGASLFLREEFALTPFWLGFAVSSAVIGCIIGPLAGAGLTDQWGRKKALYLCAILFGISAIGTALPRTMVEFYIFRILGGMGVGLASIVSPMYIAEVAPSRMRGRLVLVNQLAIVVGSLASIIVSYFLSLSGSWRWMFASELVPIVILLIGLTLVPESPRWFAQKNRNDAALGVLTRIGGPRYAAQEMERIARSLKEKTASFAELFRPGMRTALLIAFTLAVLQQFSGTSPLLFHTPLIFQRAGFDNISDAILQSIIVNIWNLTLTAIGLWAVDRFGRRPLLLTGTTAMAIGFALMGIFFYYDLAGLYLLLTMFMVVGGYVISLAPLAWLIMSEIFPTHLRVKAMQLAALGLWVSAFLGALLLPPMMSYFKETFGTEAGAFWIFMAVCIFAIVFGWRMVPETKGRSLEEIGESWTKSSV